MFAKLLILNDKGAVFLFVFGNFIINHQFWYLDIDRMQFDSLRFNFAAYFNTAVNFSLAVCNTQV